MVRAGETYEFDGIIVEIVEVNPYYTFSKVRNLMISYRIKEGSFVSPVAHLWMSEVDDIRARLKEVVEYYIQVKKTLRV
jgi:hypothetical protein